MNAEIISLTNHKDIFNQKKIQDTLSTYYGMKSQEIFEYSVLRTFLWKIRYKLYTLSLKKYQKEV